MYNSLNEHQLISVAIQDLMIDYVSIQVDIDESKLKAAALVAQNIDLDRILNYELSDGTTVDNLSRCIDPQNAEDEALLKLVIPAWCYYTYVRCLRMFQGTFTDSGFITEEGAVDRSALVSTRNEHQAIADTYLEKVVKFLVKENPSTEVTQVNKSRGIRVFGGEEYYGRRNG